MRKPGRRVQHRAIRSGVAVMLSICLSVMLAVTATGRTEAALYVQMTLSDATPHVGEPVELSVFTLGIRSDRKGDCVDSPNITIIPFNISDGQQMWPLQEGIEVTAESIDGPSNNIVIELSQRQGDPFYWDGSITFPFTGQWRLWITQPSFGGSLECAGAVTTVEVLAASASEEPDRSRLSSLLSGPLVPFIGVLGVPGVIIALWAIMTSRRKGRRTSSANHNSDTE